MGGKINSKRKEKETVTLFLLFAALNLGLSASLRLAYHYLFKKLPKFLGEGNKQS